MKKWHPEVVSSSSSSSSTRLESDPGRPRPQWVSTCPVAISCVQNHLRRVFEEGGKTAMAKARLELVDGVKEASLRVRMMAGLREAVPASASASAPPRPGRPGSSSSSSTRTRAHARVGCAGAAEILGQVEACLAQINANHARSLRIMERLIVKSVNTTYAAVLRGGQAQDGEGDAAGADAGAGAPVGVEGVPIFRCILRGEELVQSLFEGRAMGAAAPPGSRPVLSCRAFQGTQHSTGRRRPQKFHPWRWTIEATPARRRGEEGCYATSFTALHARKGIIIGSTTRSPLFPLVIMAKDKDSMAHFLKYHRKDFDLLLPAEGAVTGARRWVADG